MARELVLKFRDDLLLNSALLTKEQIKNFQFCNDYDTLSAQVRRRLFPNLKTEPPKGNLPAGWESLMRVLAEFAAETGQRVTYLFSEVDAKLPQMLVERAYQTYEAVKDYVVKEGKEVDGFRWLGTPPPPPPENLYNYFRLPLPDTYPTSRLIELTRKLAGYLLKRDDTKPFLGAYFPAQELPKPHLLTHLYLKDDPVPTTYNAPEVVTDGHQSYFNSLEINLADTGTDVDLAILETDSWDLAHGQFGGNWGASATQANRIRSQPSVHSPGAINLTDFSLSSPGSYSAYAEHGNMVLGLLWAKRDDHNQSASPTDSCMGIVPDASVRLISCFSRVTKTVSSRTNFGLVRYAEASALLLAIAQPIQSGQAVGGTILLIELAYGRGVYPLHMAPAINLLARYAETCGITVILSAGNGGRPLPASSENTTRLPSDVLSLIPGVRPEIYNDQTFRDFQNNIPIINQSALFTRYTTLDDYALAMNSLPRVGIVVGAVSEVTTAAGTQTWQRLPSSNHGETVSFYAPGFNLRTTSVSNAYTTIGSTSGAAALVAGMATALQGLAKASRYVLTAANLNQLLSEGLSFSTQYHIPNYTTARQALVTLLTNA
jgi:hypothetical protein